MITFRQMYEATTAEPRSPDAPASATFEYRVGILNRGRFRMVLAFGRSLGLDVQQHQGYGLLVQTGFITTKGRWADTRRFLDAFLCMTEDS